MNDHTSGNSHAAYMLTSQGVLLRLKDARSVWSQAYWAEEVL